MLAAPSLSRTYLSESLALNFKGNQRKRWLELSTSSAAPTVVPPDPDTDKLPSPQEIRERHIQNRARFVAKVRYNEYVPS